MCRRKSPKGTFPRKYLRAYQKHGIADPHANSTPKSFFFFGGGLLRRTQVVLRFKALLSFSTEAGMFSVAQVLGTGNTWAILVVLGISRAILRGVGDLQVCTWQCSV